MNTNKKKIGVTLPPDLHAQVKSAAPLRGMNVEQAYEHALRDWLAPGRHRAIVDMSPEEITFVKRVLAVRRRNTDAAKGLQAALEIGELLIAAEGKR